MVETVPPARGYTSTLRDEHASRTRRQIAEAARRLFMAQGYRAATMAGIASEAGVSYQTVYAVFGDKASVAREVVAISFRAGNVEALQGVLAHSADPEVWLRAAARIARLVSERLGALLRFLQESGEPELQTGYRLVEDRRLQQEKVLVQALQDSGHLRNDMSVDEVLDILWMLTGNHSYEQMVGQRGWSADRFESWLGDALVRLLLDPSGGTPGSG